jgi:hypothetical protein
LFAEIGDDAFYGCTYLSAIFIPATVENISKKAFNGCSAYIIVHPENPFYKSVKGELKRKIKRERKKKDCITEYKIAEKEFDQWLKDECERLKEMPENPLYDNNVAQLYSDVKKFGKTYPEYNISEYSNHWRKEQKELNLRNKLKYGCQVTFYQNQSKEFENNVDISFDFANGYMSDIDCTNRLNMVYSYLDLLEQLSNKFVQLSKLKKEADDEQASINVKERRIKEMQSKSAEDWITILLKNSGYQFRLEKSSARIVVYVKITPQLQLVVPIMKKNFQETVPDIIQTIKSFENSVKESKIKGVRLINMTDDSRNSWKNT